MLFNIRVITNAKKSGIVEQKGNFLKVKVSSVPESGKANRELVRLLSQAFNVRKSDIYIIKGEKSNNKIISIKDE